MNTNTFLLALAISLPLSTMAQHNHEAQTAPADHDLTSLKAYCRSCFDQPVHWAQAGQTEIGAFDQMVIGVNTLCGEK